MPICPEEEDGLKGVTRKLGSGLGCHLPHPHPPSGLVSQNDHGCLDIFCSVYKENIHV
jgi:hypothetical protein